MRRRPGAECAARRCSSADFFASSKPADAYDMVRKLPGFELIEVDDEVRGFTGSRGNVLFDGRTPSGSRIAWSRCCGASRQPRSFGSS